jgi:hypothetical protein
MANTAIMDILRPRLAGLIAQGKALKGLQHPGVKGRLREILVREGLAPFLPPAVSSITGTIVSPISARRVVRNQDDIIIFDRNSSPLLFDGAECIVPLEGVVAEVEVQTTLTLKRIRESAKAAIELRDLARGSAPLSLLFSYDSDLKKGNEAERLSAALKQITFQAHPGQASFPIQGICVASRGTWLFVPKNGIHGWWFVAPDNECHLFAFFSCISNTFYKRGGASTGVGDYLLDTDWLTGPVIECPALVPEP